MFLGSAWLQERSRIVPAFSLMLLVASSASSCRSMTHMCCRSSCTTRRWLSPRLSVFSSSSVASSGIGVPLMRVYAVRVVLSIQDTYLLLPIRLCHAVLADASHQLFFPLVSFSYRYFGLVHAVPFGSLCYCEDCSAFCQLVCSEICLLMATVCTIGHSSAKAI